MLAEAIARYTTEMSFNAPTITEADILGQVVAPGEPTLPEASARSILELRFNDPAVDQMNKLAERNRRGELLPEELELLEKYRSVGHFLNLLQTKARLSLQQAPHNG